jgi:hypothetical protein
MLIVLQKKICVLLIRRRAAASCAKTNRWGKKDIVVVYDVFHLLLHISSVFINIKTIFQYLGIYA